MTQPAVPPSRIRTENNRPVDPLGSFVLYWMTSARRTRFNFALQRAVEIANELQKPLIILEALRLDYPHASDRLHSFVADGMRDNAHAIARSRGTYYPYVEPTPAHGRGLIRALSDHAAVVITDWFPAFFLPRMIAAAAAQCRTRLESVDSCGLIPVATHARAFPTARGYRAFVQRTLREHLTAWPVEEPLAELAHGPGQIPPAIVERWQPSNIGEPSRLIARLPIDHSVPSADSSGGADAAGRSLTAFVTDKLHRYAGESNHPDADCTSRLSPYLHFGHISAHEIFSAVMTRERWTTRKLGHGTSGARTGWWNVTPGAEHFLEQLVVWRELALNGCTWGADLHAYEAVPNWARATLEAHLGDPRPRLYSLEELDAAATDDVVWNAAQNELRQTGWCHGYMRMVWGKKMLEWCEHPSTALGWMEWLMNRYSLDGRDPVSYLNYAWVLGRYDRPWFERPIFGSVRYMTTASARRKLKMKAYLGRYGQ